MLDTNIIDLGKVGMTVATSPWAANVSYERLTMVHHAESGNTYVSVKDNIGVNPSTDDGSNWILASLSGMSIYELMVARGKFSGTEAEFLAAYNAAVAAANTAASTASLNATAALAAADDANAAKIAADTATALCQTETAKATAAATAANAAVTNAAGVKTALDNFIAQGPSVTDAQVVKNTGDIANLKTDVTDLASKVGGKKNCENGKYLGSGLNNIVEAEGYVLTEYIAVTPSTVITWKYGNVDSNFFCLDQYDSNKSCLDFYSNQQDSTERSISIMSNAAFVRASFKIGEVSKLIAQDGTVLFDSICTEDGIEENLNEVIYTLESKLPTIESNINNINKTIDNVKNATDGYYLNSSGTLVEDSDCMVSDYIPIEPNKEITWIYGIGMNSSAKLCLYNEIGLREYWSPFIDADRRTFTPEYNDVKYARISIKKGNKHVVSLIQNSVVLLSNPSSDEDGLKQKISELSVKQEFKLTVLSYNIKSLIGNETQHDPAVGEWLTTQINNMRKVVSHYNADIVVITEDLATDDVYNRLWSHHYPYKYANSNQEICAASIYSKYKLKDMELITPDYSSGSDVQSYRKICKAVADINGLEVTILGIHTRGGAEYFPTERTEYFTKVLELMNDTEYVIVAGDFNTDTDNPSEELEMFRTGNIQIGNLDWFGNFVTNPSLNPVYCLDNIMAKGMTIGNFAVGDETYSDHRPITAEINKRS